MEYVNLGRTGLQVSRLCLGCMTYGAKSWRPWVLEEAESRPFYKAALDAGINFFDTADIYSLGVSEEITGRALGDMVRREDVVVATKLYNPMAKGPNRRGLGRKHVMHAIDASLKRLNMDYVDLYQIHRFDRHTPIEETIDALDEVVKAGKARYIGASSMYAYQMAKYLGTAQARGKTRFVSMQNHYNLIYREEEREMIPLLQEEGIAMIPWSPLARGFLVGNRHTQGGGDTERARTDEYAQGMYYAEGDFAIADRVVELAARRGIRPAQVALAWHLTKPYVTAPIIGASKPEHLSDAIAALGVHLSAEDVAYLEAPYVPHNVLGHS
jgi:1-deoxyxylulose-5-phosphate synthase